MSASAVGIAPAAASSLPPSASPRPVLFSSPLDLYAAANYLFVLCASGYLLGDASRVAYPHATINDIHGSNASNAWFMVFAALYVLDCSLYLLVYDRWERAAIDDAAKESAQRGGDDENEHDAAEAAAARNDDDENERAEGQSESEAEGEDAPMMARSAAAGRPAARPSSSSSPPLRHSDFASRLLHDSRSVARRARWCFFSHEGGLVNVVEVVAALIFLTTATATFFAGVSQLDRLTQRKWDRATMGGDALASALFLADSLVFQHIYVRTLQSKSQSSQAKPSSSSPLTPVVVSGFQPRDAYFWTSSFNVLASAIYFFASVWGLWRQTVISALDDAYPRTYGKNMLPMLQALHAIYLAGDVVYVCSGCLLVYAYARDRRLDSSLEEEPDEDEDSGLAAQHARLAIAAGKRT